MRHRVDDPVLLKVNSTERIPMLAKEQSIILSKSMLIADYLDDVYLEMSRLPTGRLPECCI